MDKIEFNTLLPFDSLWKKYFQYYDEVNTNKKLEEQLKSFARKMYYEIINETTEELNTHFEKSIKDELLALKYDIKDQLKDELIEILGDGIDKSLENIIK